MRDVIDPLRSPPIIAGVVPGPCRRPGTVPAKRALLAQVLRSSGSRCDAGMDG